MMHLLTDFPHTLHGIVLDALKDTLESRRSEPQIIANLIHYLVRNINKFSMINGISIKVGGVFIHGQPLVRCANFPNPNIKSVELGDLLLLSTIIHPDGQISHNALLLQAKKIVSMPTTPDNPNQHHLYSTWPKFWYIRSTPALNNKKRRISGFDINNAAQYLLLHEWWYGRYFPNRFWLAHPTCPKLSHYRDFSLELVQFILGNGGKYFNYPAPRNNINWDKVIEDLLVVTAKQYSKYMKNAHNKEEVRAFTRGIFSQNSLLAQYDSLPNPRDHDGQDPPNVPAEWFHDEENSGGISIVEFVVNKRTSEA